MTDDTPRIHDKLREAATSETPDPASKSFDDAEAEAAFWRAQFEKEGERLAKLWVAYKDLEAELEMRKEEAQAAAERKAAARLAEDQPDVEAEEPQPAEDQAPSVDVEVTGEVTEQTVEPGRGASYPVRIANGTEEELSVRLEAGSAPEGWSALTSFTELELEPEEHRDTYLLVRSPEDARPGDFCRVQLTLEARGEVAGRLDTVTVVGEPAPADDRPAPEAEAGDEPAGPAPIALDRFDEETLVQQTCRLLVRRLDALGVTLYEVQADAETLEVRTQAGWAEPPAEPGETVASEVLDAAAEDGHVLVDAVDEAALDLPEGWTQPPVRSGLFVIVPGFDEPQALLAVAANEAGAFTEEEAEAARPIARVLGGALQQRQAGGALEA